MGPSATSQGVKRLFFDHALVNGGWHDNVVLTVDNGEIQKCEMGVHGPSTGDEHYAGIALPGLPNVHSHAFQRAMAGLAETRGPEHDSFWTWREVMYRFLARLTPEDVEAIAAFAYMEMLEAGFTRVGEFHYLHHDPDGEPYADLAEMSGRIVAGAEATGIGLTLLPCFYANGGLGGQPPTHGQRRFINGPDRFLRLHEQAWRALKRLPTGRLGVAPHSLRAVTPEAMAAVLGGVPDGPIHIHAAEQTKEVEDCVTWSGLRPVEWLLANAPVDARWCLIHATHMTEAETLALARSRAVAGLCPLTEASLGDGIFNGRDYVSSDGTFAVGTDSNIEITAPGELKQIEYTQRLKHRARNVLSLKQGESTGRRLYKSALAGGEQALQYRSGSLSPGYPADIVVLDSSHPDLAAVSGDRWLDAYVFTAGRAVIRDVLIGGERLVDNGRHRERQRITTDYIKTLRRLTA